METDRFEGLRSKAEVARKGAKSIRLDWKNKDLSNDRDATFESAINMLMEVIENLEKWHGEQSAFRKEAEREIGDCLGVKGGTYRDWSKYDEAAEAYDQGLPYEESVNQMGGQPNSYCLVQRLVARILADPETFCRSELLIDGTTLQAKLAESVGILRDQMKVLRKYDPWAQADLALVLQLLGDEADERFGDDASIIAWDKLDDMHPESFVYESTCEVVKLVKEKLGPFLSNEARDSWEDLLSRLSASDERA